MEDFAGEVGAIIILEIKDVKQFISRNVIEFSILGIKLDSKVSLAIFALLKGKINETILLNLNPFWGFL